MAKVTATAERKIDAPLEKVRAAIADYSESRPTILTGEFRDYEVIELSPEPSWAEVAYRV